MKFDYRNIRDEDHFENLVADYFRELAKNKENNIANVKATQSGKGTDGGRDILLEFEFSDDIVTFQRRWVVQCKFREDNISPSHINQIDIPTLIHSYSASGYLLVCKKSPTSGITNLFERLNENCKDEYHYEVWNGDQFLSKCEVLENMHPIYFSDYHTRKNEWLAKKVNK
ncbi:MAG: restriction endonuclease [Cyclobacteriaceae bacterium]|nr:restriction endonuclease [Cyclobacteriaceae bacterium]